MKYFYTLILLIMLPWSVFGQKNGDSKIIIVVSDSTDLYQKIKYSLVNCDFIVKDNGNRDILTTYSRKYNGIYCAARAIIEGHDVILTGIYGLKRIDDWGYTQSPKNYNRIIYYKGSKSWKLLMSVASKIGGQVSYNE